MLNCSKGYLEVAGYAQKTCAGNPTVVVALKHSECVALSKDSTTFPYNQPEGDEVKEKSTTGEWAIIDCSKSTVLVPNLLFTVLLILSSLTFVQSITLQTFSNTDCSGSSDTTENVISGNCISVGGEDVTASAIYNCIPGKKGVTVDEDETMVTYALYDTASDCTGTMPPGFPIKMISNQCIEIVEGSGVYNFVDCSNSIVTEAGFVAGVVVALCSLWMIH